MAGQVLMSHIPLTTTRKDSPLLRTHVIRLDPSSSYRIISSSLGVIYSHLQILLPGKITCSQVLGIREWTLLRTVILHTITNILSVSTDIL